MAKRADQKAVSLNLDQAVYSELEKRAKAEDRTMTALLRRALANYLDNAVTDERLVKINSNYEKMSESERAWLAECSYMRSRAK